ncbi:protein arginine N-methyltransferase 2-like [Ptychodera flava]|uniref:protein arginine N-methyltransferase 2-like n=1 Tax=Ptychodera flava TaxID=63121 RepID=UPI00396A0758
MSSAISDSSKQLQESTKLADDVNISLKNNFTKLTVETPSPVVELLSENDSSDNSDDDNVTNDENLETVIAFSNFDAADNNQLSFARGDEIQVISKPNDDWWWAIINGQHGYIPANHTKCKSKAEWEAERWQDEEYFESYSNLKLHLEMLGDEVRTNAYKEAIKQNADFIKDKVVLDVGCGTGILSLFAAKYGHAKKVYAVEASEIAEHTVQLIERNGYSDKVCVISGKIEDILLPEKVDIIISEWMGTLLLFELMIESVLGARNNWLKDTGVMWPSDAFLHLVPCSAAQEYNKVSFWNNVYEFDFSYLKTLALKEFFSKPIFNHELKTENFLTDPKTVLELNMKSFEIEELEEIHREFSFEITKNGTFHGFGSWFSVEFCVMTSNNSPVTLDTGPYGRSTHWKQDLFMMDKPVDVIVGDRISGKIIIRRNQDWRRHLKVVFRFKVTRDSDTIVQEFNKLFLLWR